MSRSEIIELVDKFISKQNISVDLANKIEVAIDEEFPDDAYMQDIVEMLASYRPGGGDYLYDEEMVIASLERLRDRLQ